MKQLEVSDVGKRKIKKVLEEQKEYLLGKDNVVGLGICEKISKGKPTGKLALAVMVSQKVPINILEGKDRIEPIIEGVLTDVVDVKHSYKVKVFCLNDELPGISPDYPDECP
jgi:hypothetical protein